MTSKVFANGRKITSKAAEGKAISAFPDVWLPSPQTPATPTGVPVPYPNTASAQDTTKGSKTVPWQGGERGVVIDWNLNLRALELRLLKTFLKYKKSPSFFWVGNASLLPIITPDYRNTISFRGS